MTERNGAVQQNPADQRMEVAMGHLLRVGVLVAGLVVIAGGVMQWRQDSGAAPDYRTFHGSVKWLENPGLIWEGLLQGDGASVIQFGLLLLIATPVARVVLAVVGFVAERDWLYSVVSLLVLGILIFSLVRGG